MTDNTSSETPLKSFTLKPDGKVSTTWQVLGAIIIATAFVVGGLVSIKADIADAIKEAKAAQVTVRDMRDDLLRLRIALGIFDSASKPTTKATQP